MSRQLSVSWSSTAGTRFKVNQDAVLVDACVLQGEVSGTRDLSESAIAAVADGLAVSPCAAKASRVALQLLQEDFAANRALSAASLRRVQSRMTNAVQGTRCESMACTLAALSIQDDIGTVVHAGDCRVYLYREAALVALTEDHTVLRRMYLDGDINESDPSALSAAYSDPDSALIAEAEEFEFEIGVWRKRVRDGDLFILLSDGVTEVLDENELASVVARERDASMLASTLASIALASPAGGDNMTAVVVKIGNAIAAPLILDGRDAPISD